MLDLLKRIWDRIKNLDFDVLGQFNQRLEEIKALLVEIRDLLTGPAPEDEPEASPEAIAMAERIEAMAQNSQTLAERLEQVST